MPKTISVEMWILRIEVVFVGLLQLEIVEVGGAWVLWGAMMIVALMLTGER